MLAYTTASSTLTWGDGVTIEHELPPGLEALAIALGLLAPVLLMISVARPGLRRLALAAGAWAFVAVARLTGNDDAGGEDAG